MDRQEQETLCLQRVDGAETVRAARLAPMCGRCRRKCSFHTFFFCEGEGCCNANAMQAGTCELELAGREARLDDATWVPVRYGWVVYLWRRTEDWTNEQGPGSDSFLWTPPSQSEHRCGSLLWCACNGSFTVFTHSCSVLELRRSQSSSFSVGRVALSAEVGEVARWMERAPLTADQWFRWPRMTSSGRSSPADLLMCRCEGRTGGANGRHMAE